MCGIAGILGALDSDHRSALARMAAAMAHRGPDGDGFFESAPDAEGHGCLLAHRRLAILDLSDAARQPMSDAQSGDTIVFNGEIYGYTELRDELVCAGQRFASSGDTEVLLRWLATRGPRALGRARGMYALGLWRSRTRELVLARDEHGHKPLYLAINPDSRGRWSVVFASEVRAILASGLLGKPRCDPAAIASMVWNGFVVSPQTIVHGVESLLPGTTLVLDGKGRTVSCHEHATLGPATPAAEPTTEADFARVLSESVGAHLASDVPVGVFLSGGVDSSAVANLASRASAGRLRTFTLSFDEEGLDEAPLARVIAAAIGTDHTEVRLTEARFVGGLERALTALDQPSFDGLNSYYTSLAVREAGLKVALVGTGGDELFGGYSTFRQLPRILRLSAATSFVPSSWKSSAARQALGVMRRSASAMPPQTRWAKLPAMLAAGADLLELYQLGYALFLPEFQHELLGPAARDAAHRHGLPERMRERLVQETAGSSPLAAISALEQRLFLGERLLRDSDAASMAVSLEMRLPLVDARVNACVRGLAARLRYEPVGRKQVLRRVGLRGLDPKLFERPKSGFVMPYERWLGGALGREIESTLRDPQAVANAGLAGPAVSRLWQAFRERAPGLYWSRVWAVYVLVRWCQKYGVGA